MDKKFIRTHPRTLISDLDSLTLPRTKLLDKSKYTFKVFCSNDTVTCIEMSRGCSYACDFNFVTPTWRNMWRNKSNERIIQEMEIPKKIFYDSIFFIDDIFIVIPNVKQRESLFRHLIEKVPKMKRIKQTRADVTSRNPELIKMASESRNENCNPRLRIRK